MDRAKEMHLVQINWMVLCVVWLWQTEKKQHPTTQISLFSYIK